VSTETHVGSSQAPHHSGTGDQYVNPVTNVYPTIRDSVSERPERPPRRVAGDGVRHLLDRFVPPEGMDESRRRLLRSNVVLLEAAPGSGARSAAKILLWEYPHGQERFHELLDQAEEEGGRGRALDPEHVEEGSLLLLDLTGAAKDRYPVLMGELSSLRVTVRERHARLAVVLSTEHRDLFSQELNDLVVVIRRPEEREVLRRHLLLDSNLRPDSQDLADAELSSFLKSASVGDIAELARQIGSARREDQSDGHFKSWLRTGLSAMRPDDKRVAEMAAGLTSPELALLLAVAFLEGATSHAIYGAADQLLKITGHSLESAPSLQHQPLTDRLQRIKASAGGDRGRVRFDSNTLAETVRSYFWNNFPQLRGELKTWVGSAARIPHIERGDLLRLVRGYTRLCLRTGLPEHLTALAERWTEKSSTQELSMAARALGEGVQHPRHGSHFRRELYTWSRDGRLPRSRATVLVGVCSEALSVDFPQQALVRLHHVSHHNDLQIRKIAREALARITEHDDYLYAQLLARLLDRVRTGTAAGRRDVGTFLQVASPVRMPNGPNGRARLTELWAAALALPDEPELVPALRAWLDSAASGAGPVSPVIRLLAEACARDGCTLGTVHDTAYGWAGGDGSRHRVADALWSQATAALGLSSSTLRH
jgi:hypothetical protein